MHAPKFGFTRAALLESSLSARERGDREGDRVCTQRVRRAPTPRVADGRGTRGDPCSQHALAATCGRGVGQGPGPGASYSDIRPGRHAAAPATAGVAVPARASRRASAQPPIPAVSRISIIMHLEVTRAYPVLQSKPHGLWSWPGPWPVGAHTGLRPANPGWTGLRAARDYTQNGRDGVEV